MTYDGNGNPTTYGGKTLTFDVENRVTSVGSEATHGYRSDGLRAWKQPNGLLKTYYLYDGGNPIVELDASGAVANVNVFAPDGLVARKEGSTWNQFVFDLQGNTVQKLTTSQAVSATRLTDAWGEGVETTTPKQIDPFLFNGKWGYYYDRESALYLCQHRMYDASAGRWINRDPIGYAGGLNLYGYCGGGPVGSADPSGLQMGGPPLHDPAREGTYGYPRSLGGLGDVYDPPEKLFHGVAVRDIPLSMLVPGTPPMPVFGLRGLPLRGIGPGLGRFVGASENDCLVAVSRWGRPGLMPGDWVMKGRASFWNYLKSGKLQPGFTNRFAPFSSGETYSVPGNELRWPDERFAPLNWLKGWIGQRKWKPEDKE